MNLFERAPAPDAERIAEVKRWVAEELRLSPEAVVLVSEVRCSEPGCPPLETILAVMEGPGQRRHAKIHRPLQELERDHVRAQAFRSANAV
jgi:hypothetical protein